MRTLHVLALSAFAAAHVVSAADSPLPNIIRVSGHLFYNETGTFDKRDVFDPEFTLWNTGIGEGDAVGPSDAVLLVVELGRDPPTPWYPGFITVKVSSEKAVLLEQRVEIATFFSEKPTVSVPFLVQAVPCGTLTVVASVALKTEPPPVLKTTKLLFACGE